MITEPKPQERVASDNDYSGGPKEPVARLLDLTHGWASYVEDQEERHGDLVKSDVLHGLYQDAAQLTEITDPVAQAHAVRAFVEQQILPLLISGTPASTV